MLARQLALVGVAAASAAGGYVALRATSAFSVDRITVSGAGDPAVADDVRAATAAAIAGRGLLAVDPATVARSLALLPAVTAVRVDRAFPHELRIAVVPEVPAATVTTAAGRVVIAVSGRVIGPATSMTRLPALDAVGATLPGAGGDVGAMLGDQLVLAAALLRYPRLHATGVGETEDGLVARLGGGTEVRLGDAASLVAKLGLAVEILQGRPTRVDGTPEPTRYVDVSVPEHPVVRLLVGDAATGGGVQRPNGKISGQPPVGSSLVVDLFVPGVR